MTDDKTNKLSELLRRFLSKLREPKPPKSKTSGKDPRYSRNTVTLKTLDYEIDRYILTIEKIDIADLPRSAVHESGVKGSYVLDNVKLGNESENEFNAIDMYLYMKDNSINDALAAVYAKESIDWFKLILVVGGLAIAGCVIYAIV